MKKYKKNSGFTILEIGLIIGITSTYAAIKISSQQLETAQVTAQLYAADIYQYAAGVENWFSENTEVTTGTFKGSDWLKSRSCGGAGKVAYINCNLSETLPLSNREFNSSVINVQGATVVVSGYPLDAINSLPLTSLSSSLAALVLNTSMKAEFLITSDKTKTSFVPCFSDTQQPICQNYQYDILSVTYKTEHSEVLKNAKKPIQRAEHNKEYKNITPYISGYNPKTLRDLTTNNYKKISFIDLNKKNDNNTGKAQYQSMGVYRTLVFGATKK